MRGDAAGDAPSNGPAPGTGKPPVPAARASPPRRRVHPRALALLRAVGVLLLVPCVGIPATGLVNSPRASLVALTATTTPTFHCHVLFGSTPSALEIPDTGPKTNLASGDRVVVTVQFAAVNYSSRDRGIAVRLPTTEAMFPEPGGGTYDLYTPARWLAVTGPGWSNAANGSSTHTVASAVTLTNSNPAMLSTQKLAVMAVTPYGTLTLAFRWNWAILPVTGATTTGPYSVQNRSTLHPTAFAPAPYVQLVSTSGTSGALGTNETVDVSGATANENFFIELEHASSGHVVNTRSVTGPNSNATPLDVGILLESWDNDLAPDAMLVHVHNHCGAMLYSVPVRTAFASNATVRLSASPSGCGPVGFNGTSHASGSSVRTVPSSTLWALDARRCSGHAFDHWTEGGAVDVTAVLSNRTTVSVGYNGSLTAVYG